MKLTYLVVALALVAACSKKKKEETPAPPPANPVAPAPSTGGSGAATQDVPNAVPTPCEQAARDVKGNEGTSWLMKCPAGCTDLGNVWGTDIYTDDSRLCPAAIHAGAITAKDGGVVLVTWTPGQPTYIGSERNGVITTDYNSWGRSFYVQKVDATGKPTSPAPELITDKTTARLSCHMSSDALTGDGGAKWTAICPAGCTNGNVWGSGPYTGDSVVCRAAIHAGIIDANGGKVVVTIGGKVDKFTGSEKNGVKSEDYGSYDRTYQLSKP